jgi:hypothetical protein
MSAYSFAGKAAEKYAKLMPKMILTLKTIS